MEYEPIAERKTIIITGASSGIGFQTALTLAHRGARVILACRNKEKCEQAVTAIQGKTENEHVIFKILDLSSLDSIRLFCEAINKEEERVDILINNAGVMKKDRHVSTDGYELTFAVNFLGPFLLTRLLLGKLKASAPSRIVNVTSAMHEQYPVDLDDLQSQRDYDHVTSYARSKSALVMFSVDLAERLKGTGVTTYSLHPGVVQSGLMMDLPICQLSLVQWLFPCILPCLTCERVSTAEEGAKTTVYCALDESIQNASGQYYKNCHKQKLGEHVTDREQNTKLWLIASRMCEISDDLC